MRHRVHTIPFILLKCVVVFSIFMEFHQLFTGFDVFPESCSDCSLRKWILGISFCRITNTCSLYCILKSCCKWLSKPASYFLSDLGFLCPVFTRPSVPAFLLMSVLYPDLTTAPLPLSPALGCALLQACSCLSGGSCSSQLSAWRICWSQAVLVESVHTGHFIDVFTEK